MDLARRGPFARGLVLSGWSERSAWGYDPVLECYWAELWRDAGPEPDLTPDVRIGPEHLITTVTGLARVMAFTAEVADEAAYLALTA